MGDAPTRPGINARFSIPERLFLTLHKTNSCQFSPAPTSTSTKSFVSNIFLIPNMLFFRINPSRAKGFLKSKKIYEIANEPKYSYFTKYDNHMMEYDEKLVYALKSFLKSLN